MELLFESRKNIYKSGKVYPFQEKPVIDSNSFIPADCYTDRSGVFVGTVLKDQGMYRMWYTAWPEDYNGKDDMALGGYAESDNCVDWRKPKLGLIEYAGSKDNNLCNPGGVVYIDPDDAIYRYKACGYGRPGRASFCRPYNEEGYYTFRSKDGLVWEFDDERPRWPGGDVITAIYHPGQKRAIAAMKYFIRMADIYRRTIYTADCIDEKWNDPLCALVPDDFDDICAKRDGYSSADYYGMGMMPAGKSTVGFLWNFKHTMPLKKSDKYLIDNYAADGVVDISLVFQESKGDRWLHQPGRKTFISHDADVSSRSAYSASCPVAVGDEQWLFYSGTHLEHVGDYGVDIHKKYKLGSIHAAKWKKDRLFGFRAIPEGAVEIIVENIFGPFKLKLNYATGMEGCIKVYLYDSRLEKNGRWSKNEETMLAKTTLEGDVVDDYVSFNGSTIISPLKTFKNLLIRLEIKVAAVYAYEIEEI